MSFNLPPMLWEQTSKEQFLDGIYPFSLAFCFQNGKIKLKPTKLLVTAGRSESREHRYQ
jgi:hypothetical protein